MKMHIIMLLGCLALFACQTPAAKTQTFIPGTYVSSAAGEFSSVNDTLVFSRLDQSHYELIRRTAIQAIRKGKRLPVRREVKEYKTLWDPLQQELTEENSGLVFRFDASKSLLYVGKASYRKLN